MDINQSFILYEGKHIMPKTLVGTVENRKFAFFWLLIGGSIGNILLILYSPDVWPVFLPSVILSVLITINIADKTERSKIWLGIDLFLTCIALLLLVPVLGTAPIELTILLPDSLIIFGCILGIMNW